MTPIAETETTERQPEGWAITSLHALVGPAGVFSDGDWVESKDQDPAGDVRLVQLADVGDGEYRDRSNRFLTSAKAAELGCTFLLPGDVLIARMPDPLGRACTFPGDSKRSVTVVDVCVVRPGTADVDRCWLMHTINSPQFRSQFEELERGTTRKRISRRNLAALPIPIPPSAEQKRIAAKVEALLGKVRAASGRLAKVPALLKRFRQSVLAAACSGRLTAEWRDSKPDMSVAREIDQIDLRRKAVLDGVRPTKKPVDVRAVRAESLPDLPHQWGWIPLDRLIAFGPQNGLYKPASAYGTGTPIIRIEDYQEAWFRSREALSPLQVTDEEAGNYGLMPGDLLINRVNSPSHLGKSLVVPAELCPCVFESNMMRVRLVEQVETRYVALFFRSDLGRKLLTSDAKWAVNQASINQTDVCSTAVPLPPAAEQREIIRRVEVLFALADAAERRVAAATARAGRITQAILAKAFRGELVETEAALARREGRDYELASVLLERIRAERAEGDGPKAKTARRASNERTERAAHRKRCR